MQPYGEIGVRSLLKMAAMCRKIARCICFPACLFLSRAAHIGHGAIIHGATIGRNCLIGMNAVLMDDVELGDECIVGALAFIKQGDKIPARSLIAGNPGKIIKKVSDEMINWKTQGTRLYQQLPRNCFETLKICEPLREVEEQPPLFQSDYRPFKK